MSDGPKEDRRAPGLRPLKVPTMSQVLRDIADEIAQDYPLHAQWLRNMGEELDRRHLNLPVERRS